MSAYGPSLTSAVLVGEKHSQPGQTPLQIDGVPVHYTLKQLPPPDFDGRLPMFHDQVLVRIDAFSCNYRDKALLLSFAEKVNQRPASTKSAGFGSEFAGEIVAVGESVSNFRVGDKVMPDATYPNDPAPGFTPGVVTNTASKRWAIFAENKLCLIPDWLSMPEASAFSLAAQTAHSMVRKANLGIGDTALVVSARSNTSMAVIKLLAEKGVRTFAVSSTPWSAAQLEKFGTAKNVTFMSLENGFLPQHLEKVDAVLDPFADINFLKFAAKLKMGGSYITCGFKNQHLANASESDQIPNIYQVLPQLIINNQQLMGNCIGLKADLQAALEYGPAIKVPLDQVYAPAEVGAFIDRTFASEKFGKVVLDYMLA